MNIAIFYILYSDKPDECGKLRLFALCETSVTLERWKRWEHARRREVAMTNNHDILRSNQLLTVIKVNKTPLKIHVPLRRFATSRAHVSIAPFVTFKRHAHAARLVTLDRVATRVSTRERSHRSHRSHC